MSDDNFYSIDKLVEFGMSMAVAQQMVNTMNHAVSGMHVPGAMNPITPQQPATQSYYAMIDGKQAGPFSENEMTRLITESKISRETYIWKPGMPSWDMAINIPEVLRIVAISPPPFKPEV